MHSLAKRLYNIAPDPVQLRLADGETVTVTVESAEFFQDAFEAEGTDDDGYVYRFVSDGPDDPLVVGRRVDDGWKLVGEVDEVVAIDPAT
jgi:hypothetical protein